MRKSRKQAALSRNEAKVSVGQPPLLANLDEPKWSIDIHGEPEKVSS